jgi:hypothetical protein
VTDRLLDLTHRVLKITVVVVGVGLLLFLSLTRTQVGRDQLRDTLEQRFADTFAGELSIGELRGNLVQTLFASDVRLYDPDGRVLVQVDSVIARPRWTDLFRRSLSVGHVTLIRPEVSLVYAADSTWNLAHTFRRDEPRPPKATPWTFTSADLVLQDGRLRTRRANALPPLARSGWLWDYGQAMVDSLHVQATVEWLPDFKLLDLLDGSARLTSERLPIQTLRGQLVIDSTGVQLSEGRLALGSTDLRVNGRYHPSEATSTGTAAPTVALALSESRLDFDQLRPLLPWLPLGDTLRAHLDVRGPLSDLLVNVDTLARGSSVLQGEASLQGLPDALTLDAALRDSRLGLADLRAVWPTLQPSPLDTAGVLDLEAALQGTFASVDAPRPAFETTTTFDVRGRPGRVAGTLAAQRDGEGLFQYDLDATLDTLDLAGAWATVPVSTRLQGRLTAQGRGIQMDSLTGRAALSLDPSTIAGRALDTLHATVEATPTRIAGRLTARPRRGAVYAEGTLQRTGQPRYRGRLRTERLDLGPLLRVDTLQTDLSATLDLSGTNGPRQAKSSWTADASLQVRDSSVVRLGATTRPLRPHRMDVTVRPPGADAPRLRVDGDAFTLRVGGSGTGSLGAAAGAMWSQAGRRWVRQQLLSAESSPEEDADLGRAQVALQEALATSRMDRFEIQATLDLHDPTLVGAYMPFLPILPPLRAAVDASATATALNGTARIDRAALHTRGMRLEDLSASAAFEASLPPDASIPTITGTLDATADTLRGGVAFPAPVLRGDLTADSLSLLLRTDPEAEAGAVRLGAALTVREGANRLTFTDFTTRVRNYQWTLAEASPITISDQRLRVPALELVRMDDATTQRIALSGTYSPLPGDTLSLQLTDVALGPIAELVDAPLALEGTANGAVALSRSPRPTLAGTIRLDTLALNDRIVGTLVARSTFVPGSPDVQIDAAINPLAPDSTHLGTRRLTHNDLAVTGTARLPSGTDAGQLDLSLDVRRADAFFFEDLFDKLVSHSKGALRGTGSVRGSFRRPVFGGAFTLADGAVVIPKFGLRYQADGTARVDAEGITLEDVRATDDTGGTATINGRLLFNEYRYLSFDLDAALDDFEIIDVPSSPALPFYGHIRASGDVTLDGPVFDASLRASDAVTHPESELFIPISEAEATSDPGFIVYASDENAPARSGSQQAERSRPTGAPSQRPRTFVEGLSMDLNITAPPGSRVHLVIDPLLGDVINAVGSGRVQLQLQDDEFTTFGTFTVTAGDYLFNAGEVFVRRFQIDEGTITWDGDPADALLNIDAAYRTRASRAGLPDDVQARLQPLIPVIVQLDIRGRTTAPLVDLRLAVERGQREAFQEAPYLESLLNQPDRSTEYATSVLLTNSFLLTTGGAEGDVLTGSAFNSVSQLVASQLNRYLAQVAPNLDLTLGVQGDESINELDVTAGLALRLLDQRLVIRGEGVYRGLRQDAVDETQQALQGEFVVEVRLTPNVSVEVFYRRESDILSESVLTSTTGAGLSYQTRFPTWQRLFRRLLPATRDDGPPEDTTSVTQ